MTYPWGALISVSTYVVGQVGADADPTAAVGGENTVLVRVESPITPPVPPAAAWSLNWAPARGWPVALSRFLMIAYLRLILVRGRPSGP